MRRIETETATERDAFGIVNEIDKNFVLNVDDVAVAAAAAAVSFASVTVLKSQLKVIKSLPVTTIINILIVHIFILICS